MCRHAILAESAPEGAERKSFSYRNLPDVELPEQIYSLALAPQSTDDSGAAALGRWLYSSPHLHAHNRDMKMEAKLVTRIEVILNMPRV